MSRALVVAALAITIGGGAVVANETGFLGAGGSRSAGLFAAEVRLAPDLPAGNVEGAQPLEILGVAIDCAPAGAGPEDTQQRFFQEGEAFAVTGALASFDAVTAVVNGPNGDVSASLAQEFELRGDLSPGSMVEMTGTVAADGAMTAQQVHSACAAAGVIDCAGADDPHFELWVAAGSFEVTGRLESLTNDQIRVIGPGLIVEIARDAGTQVDGSVKAGDPVKVEGTVLDDQSLRALALALRCAPALEETPTPVATTPASPASEVSEEDESGDDDGDADADAPCNHRPRGRGALRFVVDDGEAEIKRGAVLSWDGAVFSVETPVGPITVVVDEDTETKGDLDAALDIRVEGQLQDDGSILADEIKVLCPAGNGRNGEDDEDSGEDEGEENGRGRGNGNNNGNHNRNSRVNRDEDESEDDD